jgi:hypothetical protein
MKAVWLEFRIMFAEWLMRLSYHVMPADAPEAVPMAKAIGAYGDDVRQIGRWQKFPA